MASTQTIQVPHLDATVGFELSNGKLDPAKPTLVLIVPFCATVEYYRAQLDSPKLTEKINLLAVELLGHGATTCASEHFTYWDSALVTLQAMQGLGVSKAYALGLSQGGWVVARMALLAPERILGILAMATSMDSESADSRTKGCWDPAPFASPFLQKWSSSTPNPDFVVGDDWIQPVLGLGLGSASTPAAVEYWSESIRKVYSGDQGRRRLRMATLNLAERDGLLFRIGDIKCPVHWYQGTEDPIYGTIVPQEHIKLFTGSSEAKLNFIEGGVHFLSVSHPKEVEEAIFEMVH
ncbi:putative alpha/beta hydrolase [Annulohypoxylon maeteangense]|uniref:putative alpha/beta hydrolase n=1 Tax=Annulohypoxylon maeteangense TaxID=1927788 RepID=UPI002008A2CF|nr:putative alpha/beta hydrolase [Annulohypoxylon maeteangense]KAI0886717.1 putative alpha/beta hydrolase [Annulohypoxylon maeteangense]